MISIPSCNANWQLIEEKHNSFVQTYIRNHTLFYIDVLNYIGFLRQHPKTHKVTVTRSLDSLANKYSFNANHARALANKFFRNRNAISNKHEYFKLKDVKLLRPEVQNHSLIIDSLNYLLDILHDLLYFDFPKRKRDYIIDQAFISDAEFLIPDIINYDWFRDLSLNENWNAYEFTKALNLKACVYCNRQYTFTIDKNSEKITRPELDHFYSKSENPLLSLSFRNLIPSCSVCNRDLKHFDDTVWKQSIVSPYNKFELHNYIRFTYTPLTYYGAIGLTDELIVDAVNNLPEDSEYFEEVNNQIEMFRLSEIYSEHRDLAQELIQKRWISNNRYLELVSAPFKDFNLSKEEAYRLAFGTFYEEKFFAKRPMSKFTKDIAIELGLIS